MTDEGKKFDDGKLEWDLLHYPFLEECVEVMMMGKKKYSFENWKKNLDPRRIKNALFRHVIDYSEGKKTDSESGKSHLAHIFCNAMFLFYYDHLTRSEKDEISS